MTSWSASLSMTRVAVFLLALLPFALLAGKVASDALGPDPAEALMHETGEWALRLLVLVLAARPLAHYGYGHLARYRRMLGLFVFFYASVHLMVFGQVYVAWSAELLIEELSERPYIIVGASAWLLLLPLAVTSTTAWRKRLRQNWRRLHQAVYAIAVLATLHILWLSRSDVGNPLMYGAVFAVLLGWRVKKFMTKRLRSSAAP